MFCRRSAETEGRNVHFTKVLYNQSMLLLTHIAIALSSLLFTTFLYFKPSQSKIYASYTLIGLTLGTGTVLILMHPASLSKTWMSGLVYFAITVTGTILASQKLAAVKITKD